MNTAAFEQIPDLWINLVFTGTSAKNPSADFPYLLELQPDLFDDSTRVVVVPLIPASTLTYKDPALKPEFDIEASSVKRAFVQANDRRTGSIPASNSAFT